MCSKMKSYYFSVYSRYNMLTKRRNANVRNLTWMHLKVFILHFFTHFNCVIIHFIKFILTCSTISNLEIMSVVTM